VYLFSVRVENSYKQDDNKPVNAYYSVTEYVIYELAADARVAGTYQQDHQPLAAISSSGSCNKFSILVHMQG
jgi:hypothetical protein